MDTLDFSNKVISRQKPIASYILEEPFKENIHTINFNSLYLKTSDVYQLFHHVLPLFSSLDSIFLESTSLFDCDLQIMFEFKSLLCQLRQLNLAHNLIQGRVFHQISKENMTTMNLQKLWMDHNEIDCRGMVQMTSFFPYLPNLQLLSLSGNFIRNTGLDVFSKTVSTLTNLNHLDLSKNKCSSQTFLAILQNLPPGLLHLNVGYLVSTQDIFTFMLNFTSCVAQSLQRFTNLQTLDWNMYMDQHIVHGLGHLSHLQHFENKKLFIYHGYLDYFPHLSQLKSISLSGIQMACLPTVLRSLPDGMEFVTIEHTRWNESSKIIFHDWIQRQQTLKTLRLNFCSLRDFFFLKCCAASMPLLEEISFSNNLMGLTKSFPKFILSLSSFPKLKTIILRGNYIHDKNFFFLMRFLCSQYSPPSLKLMISNGYFQKYPCFFSRENMILDTLYKRFREAREYNSKLYRMVKFVQGKRIFTHHMDVMYSQKHNISMYNHHLQKLQNLIHSRIGYLQWIRYINEELINDVHPVFFSQDMQMEILDYL